VPEWNAARHDLLAASAKSDESIRVSFQVFDRDSARSSARFGPVDCARKGVTWRRPRSTVETRFEQMFPELATAEIERVRAQTWPRGAERSRRAATACSRWETSAPGRRSGSPRPVGEDAQVIAAIRAFLPDEQSSGCRNFVTPRR
jgi:hypothetical protein